jgi:hypothetical protein
LRIDPERDELHGSPFQNRMVLRQQVMRHYDQKIWIPNYSTYTASIAGFSARFFRPALHTVNQGRSALHPPNHLANTLPEVNRQYETLRTTQRTYPAAQHAMARNRLLLD